MNERNRRDTRRAVKSFGVRNGKTLSVGLVVHYCGVFLAMVSVTVCSCQAGENGRPGAPLTITPEELSTYTKKTTAVVEEPKLVNAQFELGRKGWNLPAGYRIDRTGGRNGTSALFYERTDPKVYVLAMQALPLIPGIRYRFGAWVRVEGVKGSDSGGTICLEYSKNGKWFGGAYPQGIKGTKDWAHIQGTATIPEGTDGFHLTLYIRKGMTGKAWFDDVTIEPIAPKWTAYLVSPRFDRVPSHDARIVLRSIHQGLPVSEEETSHLACRIRMKRGDFSREAVYPVRNGTISVHLGDLPIGGLSLHLALLETNRKWILGEETIPVTVVSSRRRPPPNACLVDEHGRAIVNGKPFLPVGLYMGGVKREDLERIGRSPFNCVMPYGSMSLRFDPSKRVSEQSIREVLDACYQKDIKVIFSIKDVYEGTRWQRTEWLGAKGVRAVVEKVVTCFRDHPALLAWYVNDEEPLEMLQRLIERRRLVNRLDPNHPTWAVLYQFTDLPMYGATCDIMGVDPYPIRNSKTRDMAKVELAMDMAQQAALPTWVVPQIFNWGVYDEKAKGDLEYFRRNFRTPTEEEIRSMMLHMALSGAKGFVSYSYFDLFKSPDPDSGFDRRWPEICRVGAMLVSLGPFLLSDCEGPRVAVQCKAGKVFARGFADANGRIRVLVAGVGPGESEAIITVRPRMRLKSRYGGCSYLGRGKYRFSGTDICSDILETP